MLEQTRESAGTASALRESARRLEHTLEIVRDELGSTDHRSHDWRGLCQHVTRGSKLTRAFARALADLNSAVESDPQSLLVHVFILRQLEISMNLIARMGSQIDQLEKRLHETEQQILGLAMTRHRARG